MSNYAVTIRWGNPFPGREQKSLEVFMGAVEYFQGLKAQGQLTDHRTYLTTNGELSEFSGFMVIEGDIEKLRKILDTDAFKDLTVKARHLVDRIEQVHCVTGNEVATEVQRVMRVRNELGI